LFLILITWESLADLKIYEFNGLTILVGDLTVCANLRV